MYSSPNSRAGSGYPIMSNTNSIDLQNPQISLPNYQQHFGPNGTQPSGGNMAYQYGSPMLIKTNNFSSSQNHSQNKTDGIKKDPEADGQTPLETSKGDDHELSETKNDQERFIDKLLREDQDVSGTTQIEEGLRQQHLDGEE
jgi:hypothetical protein